MNYWFLVKQFFGKNPLNPTERYFRNNLKKIFYRI